jgi:hypothetical protein
MEKYIKLLALFTLINFSSCSTNSNNSFCFTTNQNKIIVVDDFKLYLGKNRSSVYFLINNNKEREEVLNACLLSVEFKTKDKIIKGKLLPIYSRRIESFSPFYFEVKGNNKIDMIRVIDGKKMFYIGELEDLAPEIKIEVFK